MISIVSAYYGNEDMTVEFLDNLQDKCKGYDIEMILVNSASKQINHPFVDKYVYLPINMSFSNSMNAGLKEATGKYIIIIGNDGFPVSNNWIEELISTFDKFSDAMIVTPIWDRPNFSAYKHLVIYDSITYAEMKMIPAVCWMLKKEDMDKVGLFDERFLIGCYEDDDYCKRVHNIGGKVYVNKGVKLRHLLSQTIGKLDYPGAMKANAERFRIKWGG